MKIPKGFATNAYNIIGLSTGASLGEIKKRTSHLLSLAKIEEVEQFETDLGDVKILRTESELKRALEKLTSVRDRLDENFFWFEVATVVDQNAFKKVIAEDFDSACSQWQNASSSVSAWITKKNCALAMFLGAYATKDSSLFEASLKIWREIISSDDFWSFYKDHYNLDDDLGTDSSLFEEFRKLLPDKLSRFTNEIYHQTQDPAVVGIYFTYFRSIGSELTANIIEPLIREISALVDAIEANSNMKDFSAVANENTITLERLNRLLDKLGDLNIDEFPPVKVLKDSCALRIRGSSITIHNNHNDINTVNALHGLSKRLATSADQVAQLSKDDDQLKINRLETKFVEMVLEESKDQGDFKVYERFIELEKSIDPIVKNSPSFLPSKRRVIASAVIYNMEKANNLLFTQKSEVEAELLYASTFTLIENNLKYFDINAEALREYAKQLVLATQKISDPNHLQLADKYIADVNTTVQDLKLDTESKIMCKAMCHAGIYREIAPYLRRLRYGGYILQLGFWTLFIYGIGIIFLVAGFCYKRKMF